jgi:hypothetical protein
VRRLENLRALTSDVLIDVNLVLSLAPSPFTKEMIASEMPAAIRPYSIAVVPVRRREIASGFSYGCTPFARIPVEFVSQPMCRQALPMI